MAIELTGLSFLAPIAMFILILLIVYAVFKKSEILGDSNPVIITVSIIIALIFSLVTDIRNYAQSVIPWFAALSILLLLVMMLWALAKGKIDGFPKPFFWIFFGLFALVIGLLFFKSFLGGITPYVTSSGTCGGEYVYSGEYSSHYDSNDYPYYHNGKYYEHRTYVADCTDGTNEASDVLLKLKNWLWEDEVAGAVLLIIITIVVVTVVVKG